MNWIPDASIDFILCDLPFGTTQNEWDTPIPLDALWKQYKRIIKEHGAICLFAQTPFSIQLGASNLSWLRYEWIIEKKLASGFLNCNRMPLKAHEQVLVFYKHLPTYHPQMIPVENGAYHRGGSGHTSNYGTFHSGVSRTYGNERFPRDVLPVSNGWKRKELKLHPTQKLVSVCKYFIETYTNEGDVVLDNCMGSGSTGVACLETRRNFIGFEKDPHFFCIAKKRIESILA